MPDDRFPYCGRRYLRCIDIQESYYSFFFFFFLYHEGGIRGRGTGEVTGGGPIALWDVAEERCSSDVESLKRQTGLYLINRFLRLLLFLVGCRSLSDGVMALVVLADLNM